MIMTGLRGPHIKQRLASGMAHYIWVRGKDWTAAGKKGNGKSGAGNCPSVLPVAGHLGPV